MPAEPLDGGDLDLSQPRRVHVVGVGGAGMSAIATVLAAMGHQVTGSDLKASVVTERLGNQRITVSIGHRPENLGDAEFVTYSPAVSATNPELIEAQRRGVTVVRRAEVLAAIALTKRCIAVAGTHGKTTTSSMLSLILAEAGLRPSFLIGADVNEIGTNAAFDEGEWLVVEADESYGTFRALRCEIALLTNCEPDHLDYYGTFEVLRQAFGHYLEGSTAASVVGADEPVAAELGRHHGSLLVGTASDADYPMTDVVLSRSAVAFDLSGPDGLLGRLSVPMPGLYNARNAALATVGALCAGATFGAARTALARFAGVPRRFEFRGEANGVSFVDDYAHLPGEVRSVLAAARAGEWARVVAVFQPHRYSRTAALVEDFATAFVDADVVVITDVYGAGDTPVPGVSGKLVADAAAAASPSVPVHYAATRDDLREVVASVLRPGDLCLTLGAGDLTLLPDDLLAAPRW
jgi:UDP-N-acetylmuramate--alanine ligase